MTPPAAATLRHLPPSLMTKLDALIDENIAAGVFPAMSLAVLQHGEWRYDAARGWIDPDTQLPITMNALFDLASITKLFTTTAFLSLVSAGKVTLNTPLIEIVPEFGAIAPRPIGGGQDPHSKQRLDVIPEFAGQTVDPAQVTFWHLLTHTSGLPPWRDVYNAAGAAPTPPTQPDPVSRAERWQRGLSTLYQYEFVGQPGTTVRYSDIGLMLLGEATSRLHGTPGRVDDAIQSRVLQPLDLVDVMFNPVRDHGLPVEQCLPTEMDPTWRHRRAWGEVHDENACGVGGVAGHAGLFATARSVAALGQAWLQNPGIFGIAPELAAEAKREHAETDGMRRGLGFVLKAHVGAMVGDLLSPHAFGHSGFTGTTLWVDPTAELVIALMTNSVYPGRGKPGTFEFRRAVHTLIAEELLP
jgi:serine-type D-Ala-D-Ala carboxypeptidase